MAWCLIKHRDSFTHDVFKDNLTFHSHSARTCEHVVATQKQGLPSVVLAPRRVLLCSVARYITYSVIPRRFRTRYAVFVVKFIVSLRKGCPMPAVVAKAISFCSPAISVRA
jgi:hypothetical protein